MAIILALVMCLVPVSPPLTEEEFEIDENVVLTKNNGKGGDVVIPDGVIRIGEYAFWGADLTSVTIPDSVTSIGECAFYGCTGLTSVTIPDSITEIKTESSPGSLPGFGVFADCTNLRSVTIGNGITSIGKCMFSGCTALTSVTIPGSVIKIGSSAFSNCTSLTSVTIPTSVTCIEDGAFFHCTSLKDVCFTGTEAQWEAIEIWGNNVPLLSAAIHYNSPAPTQLQRP